MVKTPARWAAVLIAVAVAVLMTATTASADLDDPDAGGGAGGTPEPEPTPTYETQYDPPADEGEPRLSCSVYANGSGMGSYCVELGASASSTTLQERFGGMEFQRCRYDEVPESLVSSIPENPKPGEQSPMLRICLDNIDWDTYSGGPDRSVSFDVVWVTAETDTADVSNPLNDFLWSQHEGSAQLPVPHLRANPNPVPLVNTETALTFTWLDPGSREEMGPRRRVRLGNGMVMVARAAEVTVDPNVEGMEPVRCAAGASYPQGSGPAPCVVRFEHSSADAQARSTVAIPEDVEESFYVTVSVAWEITYGYGSPSERLGDGFRMVVHQALPVQEAQGVNRPPQVSDN